jgi:hypothetical protein
MGNLVLVRWVGDVLTQLIGAPFAFGAIFRFLLLSSAKPLVVQQ